MGKINIFAIECAAVAAHRAAGLGRGCAGERRPTGPRQGLKPGRYAMTGSIRRGAGVARQEGVDGSPRKGRGVINRIRAKSRVNYTRITCELYTNFTP